MISFIIIGRNEGWKLERCLNSIYSTIKENSYIESEVIYVDSDSKDGSREVAKSFEGCKVYNILGDKNAAIARNIGAKESSGDVLFFIDGDMEIIASGLKDIYDSDSGLVYKFVSGNWINYHYNHRDSANPDSIEEKKPVEQDRYEYTCGGLFLIERDIWFSVNGMKTKYRRSQDWDLSLRLAKKDVLLLRKKEILANHHTFSPLKSTSSLFNLVFSGAKYYRAVLFRDHFFNIYQWKHFVRTNYTFLLLWGSICVSFVLNQPAIICTYFIFVFFRSMRKKQNSSLIIPNFFLLIFYELTLGFAILLFWPREKKLQYKQI